MSSRTRGDAPFQAGGQIVSRQLRDLPSKRGELTKARLDRPVTPVINSTGSISREHSDELGTRNLLAAQRGGDSPRWDAFQKRLREPSLTPSDDLEENERNLRQKRDQLKSQLDDLRWEFVATSEDYEALRIRRLAKSSESV